MNLFEEYVVNVIRHLPQEGNGTYNTAELYLAAGEIVKLLVPKEVREKADQIASERIDFDKFWGESKARASAELLSEDEIDDIISAVVDNTKEKADNTGDIGFSEVYAMEGGFSVRLTRLHNGHVEVRLIHDAVNIAVHVTSFRWIRLKRDLPELNA